MDLLRHVVVGSDKLSYYLACREGYGRVFNGSPASKSARYVSELATDIYKEKLLEMTTDFVLSSCHAGNDGVTR